MTQKEKILEAFVMHGYKLTLGQVLQHDYGYKFCSRLSELRKEGYKIDCIKAEKPSDNLYVMQPPPDDNGQMHLIV
jgi:hypothetical protein